MVFRSRYMPCEDCGASVDRVGAPHHECSSERLADYRMFALRDDVARLETGVRHYLDTAAGRFECWLAARQVRRQA
ncbi:hypothetical protein [Nocardioides sp. P5_C9_2]